MLLVIRFNFRLLCMESGVGLNHLCGSLSNQDILWFHDSESSSGIFTQQFLVVCFFFSNSVFWDVVDVGKTPQNFCLLYWKKSSCKYAILMKRELRQRKKFKRPGSWSGKGVSYLYIRQIEKKEQLHCLMKAASKISKQERDEPGLKLLASDMDFSWWVSFTGLLSTYWD